jgi:hypothetical protein
VPEGLFSSAEHYVLFPRLSCNVVTIRKLTVAVLSAATDWIVLEGLQVHGFFVVARSVNATASWDIFCCRGGGGGGAHIYLHCVRMRNPAQGWLRVPQQVLEFSLNGAMTELCPHTRMRADDTGRSGMRTQGCSVEVRIVWAWPWKLIMCLSVYLSVCLSIYLSKHKYQHIQ